ncbi:hypothetical protein L1987_85820 [Smallanthus sonchifolius]|uniref:Uncharacterized protein n=1 Tax=Smallanthus sonchifolius TaxID=185202 RepID=A0ACB8XZ76_9ASTR|nr:hypothetical protein L1987_85820 [Smallanthus sonchifolius]
MVTTEEEGAQGTIVRGESESNQVSGEMIGSVGRVNERSESIKNLQDPPFMGDTDGRLHGDKVGQHPEEDAEKERPSKRPRSEDPFGLDYMLGLNAKPGSLFYKAHNISVSSKNGDRLDLNKDPSETTTDRVDGRAATRIEDMDGEDRNKDNSQLEIFRSNPEKERGEQGTTGYKLMTDVGEYKISSRRKSVRIALNTSFSKFRNTVEEPIVIEIWKTLHQAKQNYYECGVFVMKHMAIFVDSNGKKLDCGFP